MQQVRHPLRTRQSQQCGATTATTGESCQNPVTPGSDHCRAGHRISRRVSGDTRWTFSTTVSPPLDDDETSDDEAESVGELDDDPDDSKKLAKWLPNWRGKALTAAGIAGGTAFAVGEAGLVAQTWAFAALGLAVAATTYLMSWMNHRHDGDRARAAAENASVRVALTQKRRVIAQVDSSIAALLEHIGDSRGRERDGYRGQMIGQVLDGIIRVFPEGTSVAMYRPEGSPKSLKLTRSDRLVPNGLHHGWTTNPPVLDANSGESRAIKSVAVTGGVEQSTGTDGRSRLFAPIVDDDTIFGVIRVDAPSGVLFDETDVTQVGTWAKLIGVAHGTRPFLPVGR